MAAKKTEDLTYTAASDELGMILDEIESGSADIDVLSTKVERAAALIRICRAKLTGTEMQVRKVVSDLSAELAAPEQETKSLSEHPASEGGADGDPSSGDH